MAAIAQSACLRCRGQKLRCSRDLPTCARCKRLNANCIFPEPSNRKSRPVVRRDSKKSADENHGLADLHLGRGALSRLSCDNGIGLTHEQQTVLIDIFFATAYHVDMLFYRADFSKAFNAGTCAKHTIMAMCAMASNYLRASHVRAKYNVDLLDSIGDGDVLGIRLSDRATTEVCRTIMQPTIETVQTCGILALFMLSRADHRRNAMLIGIKNKAARLLWQETNISPKMRSWLQAECERRALWAGWWVTCINADHYIIGSSADTTFLYLPLPASAEAMARGEPDTGSCLADTLDAAAVAQPRPAPWDQNVFAELCRVVLHFARIQDHIHARKRAPPKQSVSELLDLDHWLTNFENSLAPQLRYSKQNTVEHLLNNDRIPYILLPAMWFTARLTLHASVVPQFGGLAANSAISPVLVRASAETALNTANQVANMAMDLLAINFEPSRLVPLFGHCLYVAATIHIVFISSNNTALVQSARTGLVASLTLLKYMKPYWKTLQSLWNRIYILYEAQMSRMPSPREHMTIFTHEDQQTQEIASVAVTNRDTGRLGESISCSVLEFRHSALRKTEDVDETSQTAQELEQRMKHGFIAELESVQMPVEQMGMTALSSTSNGQASYLQAFSADYGRQGYTSETSFDPYLIDGIDWSHFDMNSLLLPINQGETFQQPFDSIPPG